MATGIYGGTMILEAIKKFKLCSTGKQLEKYVTKKFREHHYNVLPLTDFKHHIPDLIVKGMFGTFFIECKCYRSKVNFKSAIAAWKKKQSTQFKEQLKLDKAGFPVYLLMQTKDATYFQRLRDL